MSIVVAFPVKSRAMTNRVVCDGSGAEILFFTGVRYERWQDLDAKIQSNDGVKTGRMGRPASGPRPARKRKRHA